MIQHSTMDTQFDDEITDKIIRQAALVDTGTAVQREQTADQKKLIAINKLRQVENKLRSYAKLTEQVDG